MRFAVVALLFATPLFAGCIQESPDSPALPGETARLVESSAPAVEAARPTQPAAAPAGEEPRQPVARDPAPAPTAPAPAPPMPEPFDVVWDGGVGQAVWVNGEYGIVGCGCWIIENGDPSATLRGAMADHRWAGSVEVTWDATLHPTLAKLKVTIGMERECDVCGEPAVQHAMTGSSPIRIALPYAEETTNRFWITVEQPEIAHQHLATDMAFHAEASLRPVSA